MRILIMCAAAAVALGNSASLPSGLVEKRAWYPSGRLAEVHHLHDGREEGLQQAWTEDGTLYVNYEMRNGRRYGFMNARPCSPVHETR
jgi:antitoxin component YwqK of YwqJK toxin-antitoxin module